MNSRVELASYKIAVKNSYKIVSKLIYIYLNLYIYKRMQDLEQR